MNKERFREILTRVSYYNAAEGDKYFREAGVRRLAVQELKKFIAAYPRTEIEQAYLELLGEGRAFLITSDQWGDLA